MTPTQPDPHEPAPARSRDRAAGGMDDPIKLAANGIHLVRTLQTIGIQLSQMADQKANVLMGASSIVFTITLGQLRAGGPMTVPLAILAVAALISVVLAILTVQPSILRLSHPVPDEANLLFFGVYCAMPEEEFIERLMLRLTSDEATYRTMLRDIYQNGRVLQGKKYRLLGHAYRVLLAGLVMAGGAAVVVLSAPALAMLI